MRAPLYGASEVEMETNRERAIHAGLSTLLGLFGAACIAIGRQADTFGTWLTASGLTVCGCAVGALVCLMRMRR